MREGLGRLVLWRVYGGESCTGFRVVRFVVSRHHRRGRGGRRDICSARGPSSERRNSKPHPAIPSRRSARRCVELKSPGNADNDMASERETDETKTDEDYTPGSLQHAQRQFSFVELCFTMHEGCLLLFSFMCLLTLYCVCCV